MNILAIDAIWYLIATLLSIGWINKHVAWFKGLWAEICRFWAFYGFGGSILFVIACGGIGALIGHYLEIL